MDDLEESIAAAILTKHDVKEPQQRKTQQRPVQRVLPMQRVPPMQSQQVPHHDNNEPPSEPSVQPSEPQSAKMLIFLQNCEQRLITFILPKESCTLQEVLEQVNVPFTEDTHIQCMQNTNSEIDYFVSVGCTSRIEELLENHPMLVGDSRTSSNVLLQPQIHSTTKKSSCPESKGSSDALSHSSMRDLVATLTCRTIRIGSYKYTPKEKVTISSNGIKIVAPSLKDETRDVVLQIQMKEVVRILVFSRGVHVIFLDATHKSGRYIRKALDMVDDQGPYYNPISKVDPHKRITLLPDCISDEAKMAFKVLFGKRMDELNAREANEILVRTLTKASNSVTKMATRSSSASSASGAKRCKRVFPEEPKSVPITSKKVEQEKKDPEGLMLEKQNTSDAIKLNLLKTNVKNLNSKTPVQEKNPPRVLQPRGKQPDPEPVKTDGSSDALSHSSMQDLTATLTCRIIRIGSYKYTAKEKVTISSKEIKIVAPSLKDETRDVVLRIQLKEVVRILAHFSKGIPVIFLYATDKSGRYIRRTLDMVDDQGPYYNPMSKVDPHKRITLLPDCISDEAKMAIKVLFSKRMDELNSREANEILVKALTKEGSSVTKMATRSSSASSASGVKRSKVSKTE